MSNYVQSTNFATKDALSSGDPLKIVKGTEINTEYNNIATAVATKADLASPTFTGTPVLPTGTTAVTQSPGNNTTALATTAFAQAAAVAVIPSGTVMLFAQTAAPTGFTKNTTTGNNTALRLVTGTASTGGSVAFTTAFASQTPSGTVSVSGSAGNTTLTIPQIPSHTHTANARQLSAPPFANFGIGDTSGPSSTATTDATGGGGSHNHPLTISSATFSGSAINLAVSYVDVIRATKD